MDVSFWHKHLSVKSQQPAVTSTQLMHASWGCVAQTRGASTMAARAGTRRHAGVLAAAPLSLPSWHGCNLCKTPVNWAKLVTATGLTGLY